MKDEYLEEISKRFNNGTETIEDILNYCRNLLFTFENGIKMNLVEKKYLDKLIDEYKKLSAELEKKDKIINKISEEVKENLAFEKRLKRENIEPDSFNQGKFYISENINNILKEK